MEWLERLNEAVNYIEKHLEDEIDYEKVSQIACCSTFHFQRMFSYIADVTLSEYIRRRRMTCAAFDLQNGNEKVIDIALKYGYDSPTAFNRAFQSIHGMAPSMAKSSGTILKAFPPISFKISIKGDVEMDYRIEKKDTFKIVGVKEHYAMTIEESFAKIPLFWENTKKSGTIETMCSLMNREPKGILGLTTDCMEGRDFNYYIAVATNSKTPEGLDEFSVPACTWAIFECTGAMPTAMQELQKRIATEWLPTSGYEYGCNLAIEVYPEGDQTKGNYKCEVWLPVVKKA